MCPVHRKVLRNQKFLFVVYFRTLDDDLILPIGRRLGKNVLSETATKVSNYNSKLDTLMQEFRGRTLLNVQDGVHQVLEHLGLDALICAGRVGLNKEKKCLDGTRTEILNEIIDWISSTDAATPRIFWLYGQAGRGKSAIAHTIALQAKNLGILGSCFCFSRVRQHEGLHLKLFPTIARGLADRDLRLRPLLAEIIASDHSIRDTEDIAEQWEKFIFEPLSQLQDSSTGNVVVVIDALDESGVEATRETVLEVFATQGAELPANIRILLTSRPLADIGEVLNTAQYVHTMSLDDIDGQLAIRDIYFYVSTRLKKLTGIFSDEDFWRLAERSDGLFEWARLACDFVYPRVGVVPKKRFNEVMSHTSGGKTLLDEMYTTFLKGLTRGSSEVLHMFRSVMRQILWLKEPLSINALDAMRLRFHRENDRYPVGVILDFMASLLSGTNQTSTPIRPLHSSFYDFLLDEKRSKEFVIDESDIQHDLALASFRVMHDGLKFNICELLTSYARNSEVADLAKRVNENIPSHLLYSCRFWADHIQESGFALQLVECLKGLVTGEKFLFWLEVLGICKCIREARWALSLAERWLQVSIFYCMHCLCCELEHIR